MRKLKLAATILSSIVFCLLTSPVFAHDGDLGTITFDSMDMQTADHDETLNNPGEIYKGWAYMGLQNNTPVAWTDFHLKPVIGRRPGGRRQHVL